MNLIEAKCQRCSDEHTVEMAVALYQRAGAEGREAVKEILATRAGKEAAQRGGSEEVVLNGATLQGILIHLHEFPTHALTVTLRSIEL